MDTDNGLCKDIGRCVGEAMRKSFYCSLFGLFQKGGGCGRRSMGNSAQQGATGQSSGCTVSSTCIPQKMGGFPVPED